MSVWNKVREGIDKAGKAAQDAFDEGKTRIEAYRAREQADKAAEALGYAVFRAAEAGMELEAEGHNRLMRSLRERDAEAHRLETLHANESAAASASSPASSTTTPGTPPSPSEPPQPTAGTPSSPGAWSPPAADASAPFSKPPTEV